MAGQVRHLKAKGGRFYAVVAVPKVVQATLGKTQLLTPLGSDRREAMRALPGAVAVLQGQIELARRQVSAPEVEALVRNVTLSTTLTARSGFMAAIRAIRSVPRRSVRRTCWAIDVRLHRPAMSTRALHAMKRGS